jgi:hypothetical protein
MQRRCDRPSTATWVAAAPADADVDPVGPGAPGSVHQRPSSSPASKVEDRGASLPVTVARPGRQQAAGADLVEVQDGVECAAPGIDCDGVVGVVGGDVGRGDDLDWQVASSPTPAFGPHHRPDPARSIRGSFWDHREIRRPVPSGHRPRGDFLPMTLGVRDGRSRRAFCLEGNAPRRAQSGVSAAVAATARCSGRSSSSPASSAAPAASGRRPREAAMHDVACGYARVGMGGYW